MSPTTDTITGGYTTTTAPSYASAWQSEFTSGYGISGSPDWVAGAGNAKQAAASCGGPASGKLSGSLAQGQAASRATRPTTR